MLLHLSSEMIKIICSLLYRLSLCHFAFAVVLAIRDSRFLCYIDTADMLAIRDSGLFYQLDTAISEIVFLATVKFCCFMS